MTIAGKAGSRELARSSGPLRFRAELAELAGERSSVTLVAQVARDMIFLADYNRAAK